MHSPYRFFQQTSARPARLGVNTVLDAPGAAHYDAPMRSDGGETRSVPPRFARVRAKGPLIVGGACAYLCAWVALNLFVAGGVDREAVRIDGPDGKPCVGTVWTLAAPKAVIVVGHGVTANQGVMAAAASTFARNGYVAVTIDFWGHGRSRERFDWRSNPAQVNAWCDWARARFAGLPLAYLGHSMGGEAGDRAFRDGPSVDAFVSMGMLPREVPACKTLFAFGRFEELFSAERARRVADGKADVLISPFSDHTLEAADPVLLQGIVAWLDQGFGFDGPVTFPWRRWSAKLIAAIVGCAAALILAEQAVALWPRSQRTNDTTPTGPPGRFNAFRIAARALGCTGTATPPRSGGFVYAAVRGIVFGAVLVVLLSGLLTANIYTCRLDHPERCVTWLILAAVMTPLFLATARALERFPLETTFRRFAVGALTRATPLLVLCVVFELMGPGIAFLGMMLGILALVFVFISGVYALATRGTGDYRSGALACGVTLAWITAFWFPLVLA